MQAPSSCAGCLQYTILQAHQSSSPDTPKKKGSPVGNAIVYLFWSLVSCVHPNIILVISPELEGQLSVH